MDNIKALILFSGGQDSTTCLFWGLSRFKSMKAVTFNYGQLHLVEVEQAQKICKDINIHHQIIDIPIKELVKNCSLTDNKLKIEQEKNEKNPNTFLDGRNILMLTYAAIIAKQNGIKNIITGVCQTDYSGYPDCRDNFIKSMQVSLSLGMDYSFIIHTPLMYLTKAETFKLAKEEGCLEFVLKHSHTCYRGDRSVLYSWGYGCGDCPACNLRKKGFEGFKDMEHLC